MRTTCLIYAGLAVTLSLTASGGAVPARTAPSTPDQVVEDSVKAGKVAHLKGDYTLRPGQRVESVEIFYGTGRIEGEVEEDVEVIFGVAKLAGTARVGGDVVVVGGEVEISPGAVVDGDVVAVSSTLDVPPGFTPGGEYVTVGSIGSMPWARQLAATTTPWITRGLLWGRPIVPSLPWVWGVVAVFALLCLLLNLVFEGTVRACTRALSQKPLTTGLGGLLVLLLIAPVSLILTLSIVGLVLVPFLWFALLIAALIGNVSVACWIGSRILAETSPSNRLEAMRSLGIGLGVIILVYMVPVLGFTAWALVGLLGLGAAASALLTGLRQENPRPPAPTIPPPTAEAASDAAVNEESETSAEATATPSHAAAASDVSGCPRATLLRRLGALLLDFFLVMMITIAVFEVHFGLSLILLLCYRVALWSWKASTVGGIICQLRVARLDGTPVGFTDSLVRGLASIFSAVILGLGWLWILWDPERQAWHDKIAGTIVVRVPTGWPI